MILFIIYHSFIISTQYIDQISILATDDLKITNTESMYQTSSLAESVEDFRASPNEREDNEWKFDSLQVDSPTASDEEFFDCLGMYLPVFYDISKGS